jgi:hypothetical protein
MCYNIWNRIFAENVPKILKKICQNMNMLMLPNSYHGSLVERPHPIRRARVQSEAKKIVFKLGLSPAQDEKAGS